MLLDRLYLAYNLFCVVIDFNIPFFSHGFFAILYCLVESCTFGKCLSVKLDMILISAEMSFCCTAAKDLSCSLRSVKNFSNFGLEIFAQAVFKFFFIGHELKCNYYR